MTSESLFLESQWVSREEFIHKWAFELTTPNSLFVNKGGLPQRAVSFLGFWEQHSIVWKEGNFCLFSMLFRVTEIPENKFLSGVVFN